MKNWYSKYTNTALNHKAISMPGTKSHVLTVFNGKILAYDARNGPVTEQVQDKFWLVDLNKRAQAKTLAAAGNKDGAEAAKDASRSKAYKDMLAEAAKQKKTLESTSEPAHLVLAGPLAAAGQILDTAYEVTRRVNYLEAIAGKSYDDIRFQALNIVNEVPSEDQLNVKGFTQDELLEGQPEIGDNIVPDPVKASFSFFEKQIFADSFRFDISMREQKDSQVNIAARIKRQIAGIMKKMVNDKVVTIVNAKSSAGDLADWDTRTSGAYDNDAAGDIEDGLFNLQDYDGDAVFLTTSQGMRLYRRNTEGINVETAESGFKARTGRLPFHEDVIYYIDNAITANTCILVKKDHYLDWYNGPRVNVAFQNELTPANMQGNILFHFNGVKAKITTAAQKNNGFT